MSPNRPLRACIAAALAAALLPAASAAVPTVTDGVVLNEVLANPGDGDVEAVELYNPTSEAVSVDGWTLDDDDFCIEHEDAPDPKPLEGAIGAGDTKVVELPNPYGGLSCVSLSKSSDVVLLRDADGVLADAVCWGDDCQEHPEAHQAPGDVAEGNTASRCHVANGAQLSDESEGSVGWTEAPATLDRPNAPCTGLR